MPFPTFHLRRVHQNKTANHNPEELILLGEVTKFGRNADNVDVVLTSAVYSNMISRDHAIITGRVDPSSGAISDYRIRDNSLNGTYIDDKRVKDEISLRENGVIKFGHMNGAAIKAGMDAPQANAEFSFVFEKCLPTRRYIGWEGHRERRRTVVCTGDGKPISETGEDHRVKRERLNGSGSRMEPVSSTTTSNLPPPYPMTPSSSSSSFATPPSIPSSTPESMFQSIRHPPMHMMGGQSLHFPFVNPSATMHPSFQSQLSGLAMRNGQFPGVGVGGQPPVGEGKSSSSGGPIRSPPVECDSSVPSPPKNGDTSSTAKTISADSSSNQKDDDDDAFSVPDSPPRAPRPQNVRRSVTNSPAPPSPKPVEKAEPPPKEEKKKTVIQKKRGNPGKVPKTGGGGTKKKNKEVDQLLTDLTEGSFMMQASRRSEGAGSERRKLLQQGKKEVKKPATKNKLNRQCSEPSSDPDSELEDERPPPSSLHSPRLSTTRKQTTSGGIKKTQQKGKKKEKKGMKRVNVAGSSKREESDESDPYEESDESDVEETNNGKKGVEKKAVAVKRKAPTPKGKDVKKTGGKKKKGSDSSSGSDAEAEDEDEEKGEDDERDWTFCHHKSCTGPNLPPGDSDFNWVECEVCRKWIHMLCAFKHNNKFGGGFFSCDECKKGGAKKKTKK